MHGAQDCASKMDLVFSWLSSGHKGNNFTAILMKGSYIGNSGRAWLLVCVCHTDSNSSVPHTQQVPCSLTYAMCEILFLSMANSTLI